MNSPVKWKDVRHFKPHEFDDPLHPGSGEQIDDMLLFQLDRMRHTLGWSIITHSAVGGAIDVDGKHGHSENSYHLLKNGAEACDFHFITDTPPRIQALEIEKFGFPAVGFYYDWHWGDKLLPIGFHVDMRPKEKAQRWTRRNGEYLYWWGRN